MPDVPQEDFIYEKVTYFYRCLVVRGTIREIAFKDILNERKSAMLHLSEEIGKVSWNIHINGTMEEDYL